MDQQPNFKDLKGFTPIDECPPAQLPRRWWSWGKRGAVISLAIFTLPRFFDGSFESDDDFVAGVLFRAAIGTAFGFLVGARIGKWADVLSRDHDERMLAEQERNAEAHQGEWAAWFSSKD